jgi:hypothetical protein
MKTETKDKTKTKTETILQVMNVLTWIVFIGLLIQGGSILFSYVVGFFNPEVSGKLYPGLDFSSLRETDFRQYTAVVSFIVVLYGLKAYTAYLVIMIISKINLTSPFSKTIADLIEKISYVLFEIFIISVIFNEYSKWLDKSYILALYEIQWVKLSTKHICHSRPPAIPYKKSLKRVYCRRERESRMFIDLNNF